MKIFILILAIFAAVSTKTQAQTTSSKDLIRELFIVMHQDSMMAKTMDVTAASMAKQMTTSLSMVDSATARGITDAMNKSMTSSRETTIKLMKEDMVDIYARYFTSNEISEFIVFYKTAAGQKMISMTPLITKDVMDIMSAKYTPAIQQALLKDMQKVVNELKLKEKM